MTDFRFKKSLGQNFLVDSVVPSLIVEGSQIEDNSLIIEIGPGSGALTEELLATNNKVLAFEVDTSLKPILDEIKDDNLQIVYEDFLKVDVQKYLADYEYDKLYVVANIPYYITSPIIEKLVKDVKPYSISIMIQKEVADRIGATSCSRAYNSFSVFVQYYYDVSKICDVNRNCFFPVPNVDSTVLKLTSKEVPSNINEDKFFKFVRDCFHLKRKNLRNNLKDYDEEIIGELLNKIGKDLTFRAEQLTIDDFIYLFSNYNR